MYTHTHTQHHIITHAVGNDIFSLSRTKDESDADVFLLALRQERSKQQTHMKQGDAERMESVGDNNNNDNTTTTEVTKETRFSVAGLRRRLEKPRCSRRDGGGSSTCTSRPSCTRVCARVCVCACTCAWMCVCVCVLHACAISTTSCLFPD